MNVLILTGRFGMGHYSAAEAIRQEIMVEAPEAQVDVVDMIEYMFPTLSRGIYRGFHFMVSKCSYVYNVLNKAAARCSEMPMERTVRRKLEKLLTEHRADLVIATLPICSQYISAYKKMTGDPIPLYTYVTDVTVQDEWVADETDMYFVGTEMTKSNLAARGIPEEKVIVSGIPVRQAFKNRGKKNCCQHRRGNRSFHPEKRFPFGKEVLIMGGGLGLIPAADVLLKSLIQNNDICITIIVGKNKKLQDKLTKDYPGVRVVGYTDQVERYMDQADLIVTKSGGITTFEAIHCKTPLYVIRPFLCQETGNAHFIESNGIGSVMWHRNTDLAEDVLTLLRDDARLEGMQDHMTEIVTHLAETTPLQLYRERGGQLCG